MPDIQKSLPSLHANFSLRSILMLSFRKRGVLLYIGAGGWRMFFGWAWYHLNKFGVFCEKTYRAALFRSLMLDFATHVGL